MIPGVSIQKESAGPGRSTAPVVVCLPTPVERLSTPTRPMRPSPRRRRRSEVLPTPEWPQKAAVFPG